MILNAKPSFDGFGVWTRERFCSASLVLGQGPWEPLPTLAAPSNPGIPFQPWQTLPNLKGLRVSTKLLTVHKNILPCLRDIDPTELFPQPKTFRLRLWPK